MNILSNFIVLAANSEESKQGSMWGMLAIYAVVILAFYFLFMRPQRKRQKEETKMRDNVQVGDQIVTIGGVCGRVLAVKEKDIVIETGADRNKMTIKKWAVQINETVHDVE